MHHIMKNAGSCYYDRRHCILNSTFLFSKCVVTVSNDAYFYCANENASTNSEGLSFPRFKKNMQDIQAVFDFGEEFLRNVKAEKWIQEDFREFRRYYARIWRNLPNGTYIGIEKNRVWTF